jgi:hypothetical protein
MAHGDHRGTPRPASHRYAQPVEIDALRVFCGLKRGRDDV